MKQYFLPNTQNRKKLYIRAAIFIIILGLTFFTRFYELSKRADFGWDQVDNAWASYDILVKHKYPLVGMEGKLNSGMFIGPLYYYFITPFYFASRLDPIASPIIAGVSSIIGFIILFWVTKKIFNTDIALIAVFINAVSYPIINADRMQWPVNLIAPVSYLILYFLYRALTGSPKYLPALAATTGLAFHIHFTAVFFPLIILCALPFLPRNKISLKYLFLALPLFLIFLIPNMVNTFGEPKSGAAISQYFQTYYHGIHLRRILQLAHDAFIKFETVLYFKFFRQIVFIFYPIFVLVLIGRKLKKENWLLALLYGLWIIIPWLVFAAFAGEITDYYFNSTLFIVISILAYLTYRVFQFNFRPGKIAIAAFWIYFSVINLRLFLAPKQGTLSGTRESAKNAVNEKRQLKFGRGNAEFYLYNYLMLKQK